MTHNAIRKMVMLSLYAAIALALFVLESQIPIPADGTSDSDTFSVNVLPAFASTFSALSVT